MNILERIIEQRKRDVNRARGVLSETALRREALDAPMPPDFVRALTHPAATPAIIAEIKRASPSKGLIRKDFSPAALAQELEQHGAAALSVLTEPHYFQGAPEYLQTAAETVSIPILCKDFIVDPYQIYQARSWGASAVLLIAAVLSVDEMQSLCATAAAAGLSALVEIHNSTELETVLSLNVPLIGINSRDLKNFHTSIEHTVRLLHRMPQTQTTVAESGISSHKDIVHLTSAGANAFLVGEHLMRSAAPGEALTHLRQGP